jgi:hypothetical protein
MYKTGMIVEHLKGLAVIYAKGSRKLKFAAVA